jgi:hypothetical protein
MSTMSVDPRIGDTVQGSLEIQLTSQVQVAVESQLYNLSRCVDRLDAEYRTLPAVTCPTHPLLRRSSMFDSVD